MTEVTNDPWGGLAVEREEAEATVGLVEKRDQRICACGHAMTRHNQLTVRGEERLSCTPIGTICPCRRPSPVIEVSDTRPFMRKTIGLRAQHALVRGIAGLTSKEGRTWKWLEGWPRCELSEWAIDGGCSADGVVAVSLDERGTVRQTGQAWNFMVCRAHEGQLIEKGFPMEGPAGQAADE